MGIAFEGASGLMKTLERNGVICQLRPGVWGVV